jgi:hypothetical protein
MKSNKTYIVFDTERQIERLKLFIELTEAEYDALIYESEGITDQQENAYEQVLRDAYAKLRRYEESINYNSRLN